MHSTHNQGKFVVAERFVRTLKINIYKHMTSISKNVYIDKLADIVNEYTNTYHIKIKMKLPVDVKSSTYIDFDKKNNNKDPKFKVGGRAGISKYRNIYVKDYVTNWSEEVFMIKYVTCRGHMLIVILTVKKLLESFTKKICKRQIKKNLG